MSSYALGSDIFAWAGEVAHSRGSLVFVGTSMPAAAGSLRDRIPLIFIGGALDRAWRTAVMNARNAARAAGANALIVVVDPAITSDDIRQRATLFDEHRGDSGASTIFLATTAPVSCCATQGRPRAMVARKGAGLSPVSLATTAHVAIPVQR
jgi:hypothetical protein